MGIKIPLEIMMKVTGKSNDELEKEKKQREINKKDEEKYKILLNKYGNMINLYNEFSYKNEKGEYSSKYFNEVPIKIVEKFSRTKLSSTKLRQYYDIVNGLYQGGIKGETLKSELYIVLAKANYDNNRKNIVPKEFVDFLRINIDMIFDKGDIKENFRVFKKHFEAVVAYAKGVLNEK